MSGHNDVMTMLKRTPGAIDELSPEVRARMRQFRLRLSWRRRAATAVRSLALPAAMLLVLIVTVSVPLPTRAAQLGAGWSVRVVGDRSAADRGATIAPHNLATTRIAFGGTLVAAARRTTVTLVLQRTSGGEATTVGTLMLRADRVFGTQPTSLPAIFSELGVTPRPATTYRIAVDSGGTTLVSTAVTLTRQYTLA